MFIVFNFTVKMPNADFKTLQSRTSPVNCDTQDQNHAFHTQKQPSDSHELCQESCWHCQVCQQLCSLHFDLPLHSLGGSSEMTLLVGCHFELCGCRAVLVGQSSDQLDREWQRSKNIN